MSALLNLTGELTGMLPGLSPILAETYVQRAWQDICDQRLWSFLVIDGAVVCPAVITSGLVSYTQYSQTITLDATASAAVAAQAAVGATPGITNLQIRVYPSGAISPGQIYSITAADTTVPAAVVLTTDRPIVETTGAAVAYQIYRVYITPPVDDFRAWLSFVDLPNAITLRRNVTSSWFDVQDPQRTSQGLAYNVGSYAGNRVANFVTGATIPNVNVDAGTNVFELWPGPTQGQTFYVRMRRSGAPLFSQTDAPPPVIGDGLVLQRALGWYAYPFLAANVANFPTFRGVNVQLLIAGARTMYNDKLLDAKRNDNESALQDVWNTGHGLRDGGRFGRFKDDDQTYPIDSNFLQSHLIRF